MASTNRKLVRKSAWSSELGPSLIAVPLILWLPKGDIADDLEAAQVRCDDKRRTKVHVLEEKPSWLNPHVNCLD